MNTKTKISLTLALIMVVLFIVMLINIVLQFKNYGTDSVENKAQAIAETIKDGLTAHMVNGVIANRGLFLEQISELKNVNKIWVVRGENVTKQYGAGLHNENPRDSIDQEVLSTGKTQKVITDQVFGNSSLRITIPYNATQDGKINCLQCHNANVGDTLGAISIELSMDELKNIGLNTIAYTAIIAFILIICVLLFVHKLINPYLGAFDSIKEIMQEAQKGNYSKRISESSNQEVNDVFHWINALLEKLQTTLADINQKIDIFLTNKDDVKTDPLLDVKQTVNTLSNIYKFRKTIEHDTSIEEVYGRLAYILENEFGLDDFNFVEADTINKKVTLAYSKHEFKCEACSKGCRADISNTLVDSTQFENVCDKFQGENGLEYLCVPYSISNELDFIISIISPDKATSNKVRHLLPYIQDYVDTARPEIVSKKLTEALNKSARTDPLTGLFNRKYMEESIEKIIAQAKRTKATFGILMCDIDYFKMINDTYGHDVGDEAIRIVAKTLVQNTRNSDIVVRYGGEEFVVILHNCDSEYIFEVAEKIRIDFSKQKIKAQNDFFTKTISIGACMFPEQDQNFWKCIKYADLALYEAKHTGRNKVVVFHSGLVKEDEFNDKY